MEKGVGIFSAVCVVLNMMIGAGFLALPSSFYGAGIGTSIIILCIVGYLMIISCTWEGRCVVQCGRILKSVKIPEVTEAFRVFAGSQWRNAYATVLAVSLISCSWVLAILFGHTLVSSIPSIYRPDVHCFSGDDNEECTIRYNISILILAILTTPLALMDISEQWYIQNTLTFIRVLRMVLMCVTPMLATTEVAMRLSFPASFDNSSPIILPPTIFGDWHGVCLVLSTAVFGLFLNANVPIIIDSLADKNNYLKVIHYAFGICMLLYIWLAIVISYRFGNAIANPCNLNWTGFRWNLSEGEEGDSSCTVGSFCDLSARLVEFIVVFCPAVDVASAYPFISIVLGNSLTEIIIGVPEDELIDRLGEGEGGGHLSASMHSTTNEKTPLTSSIHDKTEAQNRATFSLDSDVGLVQENALSAIAKFKKMNKWLRFAMNTFPLVLSVCMTSFSIVIQLTGAISVLICLVFPAYLSIRCNRFLDQRAACNAWLTPSDLLLWIDRASAYAGKVSTNPFDSPVMLGGSSGEESAASYDPDKEIVEQETFKWTFLWIGVVATGVIFYISVVY